MSSYNTKPSESLDVIEELFDFEGEHVRVILDDGDNPWWVLQDVCRVLSLTNSRMVKKRVNVKYLDDVSLTDITNRTQKHTVVNEPGLYSVIFKSDKPEAIRFQEWVFEVVLPSIRKHKGIVMESATATDLSHLLTDLHKCKVTDEMLNKIKDRGVRIPTEVADELSLLENEAYLAADEERDRQETLTRETRRITNSSESLFERTMGWVTDDDLLSAPPKPKPTYDTDEDEGI